MILNVVSGFRSSSNTSCLIQISDTRNTSNNCHFRSMNAHSVCLFCAIQNFYPSVVNACFFAFMLHIRLTIDKLYLKILSFLSYLMFILNLTILSEGSNILKECGLLLTTCDSCCSTLSKQMVLTLKC